MEQDLSNYSVNSNLGINTNTSSLMNQSNQTNLIYSTCWDYWQGYHYPKVIYESYPVYLRDRAEDKGRQAFEIIKHLQDKKLIKLDKVSDFIDAMDILIKIL